MKTIAIIASCDTKMREVDYMKSILLEQKTKVVIVDMSIGLGETIITDITREKVFEDYGLLWGDIKSYSKGKLMELMAEAMESEIVRLYEEGRIDGVIGAGGVQNTTIATRAMQGLPIGFPKVMVTTIASGNKKFEEVVGRKDIVTIPAIVDLCGINIITETILKNACICVANMAKYGGEIPSGRKKPVVGVTLMGITNDGGCAAIDRLKESGVEALGFHATGAGGAAMERMAQEGIIDGILDMTTHEIVSEYFRGGFSYGNYQRLTKFADLNIPIVVSVGGLDFIDYDAEQFPYPLSERKYNKHNQRLIHIKLVPEEAKAVAEIFIERLNCCARDITLVLPTDGMRKDTRKGQSLYDPEVDSILFNTIIESAADNIQIIRLEGNLNTKEWGEKIAEIMIENMKRCGF